jgi:hypothetical protein
MNTRRLTKKYKYKNRNKKTRRSGKTRKSRRRGRSGRRILKGGVRQSVIPSVRPNARPSAAPVRQSASFKQPQPSREEKLFDSFFLNLEEEEENFEKTLCALYNIYNSLSRDKINQILHSSSFKTRYEGAFYFRKETINQYDVTSYNLHPKSKYILFLSYIFKKMVEGEFIRCNGIRQDFVYNKHQFKIRMLSVLKIFLGYLDTACVCTISYPITGERYNEIVNRIATGVTKEEYAMYEIVSSLQRLVKMFPSLQDILDTMTLIHDGIIFSYNINTTILSRLIRQSYTELLDTRTVVE